MQDLVNKNSFLSYEKYLKEYKKEISDNLNSFINREHLRVNPMHNQLICEDGSAKPCLGDLIVVDVPRKYISPLKQVHGVIKKR
ncbi:MAG: hypothetical protein ACOCUH_04255, partial [Bacteriovoracia bacterium]